jgi:hypothetical protein
MGLSKDKFLSRLFRQFAPEYIREFETLKRLLLKRTPSNLTICRLKFKAVPVAGAA